MNKVMLWVFPLGVIAGGPFFPLAILFYWLSNNSWTFGQLWAAHRIQDKQKAEVSRLSSKSQAGDPLHQAEAGRPTDRPEAARGAAVVGRPRRGHRRPVTDQG